MSDAMRINTLPAFTLTTTTDGVGRSLLAQMPKLKLQAFGADCYVMIGGTDVVAGSAVIPSGTDPHSIHVPNDSSSFVIVARDGATKISAKTATGSGTLVVTEFQDL